MDPNLNKLLNWSLANSSPVSNSFTDPKTASEDQLQASNTTIPNQSTAPPQQTSDTQTRGLNADVLASLFGGPSDADLMIASMQAITSTDPEVTLDDKIIAFDNFEQLIENLDNANNLGPTSLWTPLLDQLKNPEKELRKMAAWCVGTAVQNNEKSQERCLALGGVEALTSLAISDSETKDVRRKAVYALSSEVRNYQAAMDVFVDELNKAGRKTDKTDASDMDKVDDIITGLREEASKSTV